MLKNDFIKQIMYHIIVVVIIIVIVIGYSIFKNRYENWTEDFSNKIQLNQVHNIELDGIISNEINITEQGELICISPMTRKIYFVDLLEGKIIKSINIEKSFKYVKTVRKDDTLYIVFDEEYLYFVDISNRELKTVFHNDKKRYYDYEVIVSEDVIIMSNLNNSISVLEKKSGNVIASKYDSLLRFVDLYEDILYYSTSGINIYAANLETLELIWEHDENMSHTRASIDFYNNYVFFSNFDSVKIFDAKTGEIIDEYRLDVSEINVVDNTLYSVNYGDYIINSEINTGNIIWKKDVDTGLTQIVGDYMFVKDDADQTLKKINRFNGYLIYETSFEKVYFKKIISSKNYDVVDDRRGHVYLINKKTGEKLWRSPKAKNDDLFWSVFNDYLIISTGDNKISVYNIGD